MITLSPNHPVLALKLKIESISFSGGRNTDRLANKVSGKRKRGGQQLVEDSVICTLKCRAPKSSSSSFGTDAQKRDAKIEEEKDQSFKQSINPGSVSNPEDNLSNDDKVTGAQNFSGAKNSFRKKEESLSDNASKDEDDNDGEEESKEKKEEAKEKKEESKEKKEEAKEKKEESKEKKEEAKEKKEESKEKKEEAKEKKEESKEKKEEAKEKKEESKEKKEEAKEKKEESKEKKEEAKEKKEESKEKKEEAKEKKEEAKDGDKEEEVKDGVKEEEGLMYTYYPIVSGIKGTLIEINEKLVNNPQLIVDEVRK